MNETAYTRHAGYRRSQAAVLLGLMLASSLSLTSLSSDAANDTLPVADSLMKKLSQNTATLPAYPQSTTLRPLSGQSTGGPSSRSSSHSAPGKPLTASKSLWLNTVSREQPLGAAADLTPSQRKLLAQKVSNPRSSDDSFMMTGTSSRQTALSAALPNRVGVKEGVVGPKPNKSYVERNGGFIFQGLSDSDTGTITPTSTKALKGKVTTLTITKGRSQIIKFAQPISRIAIADPTLVDIIPLSPEQLMINGKQRGTTSLIVWDKNGQEGIFDMQVQVDNTPLMDAIEAIAPNEKIEARITDTSLIISGQVSNTLILDEIRRLAAAYGFTDANFIDLTETPTPQVVLQVKIAEASRNVVNQLNTSFAINHQDFKMARLQNIPAAAAAAGGTTTAARTAVFPTAQTLSQQFRGQTTANTGGIFGGLVPLSRDSTFNLQQAFDFLETSGRVSTLAHPTLVCTHGRDASFLAGGEFPFVQGTDQNGSPLIQFKDFGVKLNFTPWISIRTRRIELKIAPEVSQLDNSTCITGAGGAPVCGLTKRSSSTIVELNDGETLMISGLISRDEQKNFSSVPYISNVPILGALFKNPNFQKRESEMIVLVTPHIIDGKDYGKYLQDSG